MNIYRVVCRDDGLPRPFLIVFDFFVKIDIKEMPNSFLPEYSLNIWVFSKSLKDDRWTSLVFTGYFGNQDEFGDYAIGRLFY